MGYNLHGLFETPSKTDYPTSSGKIEKPSFDAEDPDRLGKLLDPYGGYYFALEITAGSKLKGEIAHFQEFSGLKTSNEVVEIVEGGLNDRVHKRPGQGKWENITLRYATNYSLDLLGWRDEFLGGDYTTRPTASGAITIKNNHGDVIRRYEFKEMWPVSWEGPSLNAGSSDMAVESLEIAFSSVTVKNE